MGYTGLFTLIFPQLIEVEENFLGREFVCYTRARKKEREEDRINTLLPGSTFSSWQSKYGSPAVYVLQDYIS